MVIKMTGQLPQSICIVRLSALGDVLMAVPLIRTLQKQFPHARLTWVISQPAYDLVSGINDVEFILIDKPNHLKDYWQFRQRMRDRHFDVLLAIQSSFRANLLYACIRAKRRIGYDPLRSKDGHAFFINERIQPGRDHTLDGFLRFAEVLGVSTPDIRWDLSIDDAATDWARAQLANTKKPILLVNPAASKPERSWPVARYIEVIREAQHRWQASVFLIGGPSAYDKELGDAIVAEVPVKNLIGLTKPKQLLALIRLADALLCPDTGPSHMAAAVGTPVVALHAVTSADVSGPYTFRHLAVDYYPQAMREILGQTPETHIWGTHAHGMHTMSLVPVHDVLVKLEQILQ